jgi:hypothetical protein
MTGVVCVTTSAPGSFGGRSQHRRRDYCGSCQAVQEETFLPVGWLGLQDRGQGGAAPYSYPHPGRGPLTDLPRWAAVQRACVEVEESRT